MSLESELKKLTAAVEAHTAALTALSQPSAPTPDKPTPSGNSGRGRAAAASSKKDAPAIELATVQDAVLKLVSEGMRERAVGILAEFGVEKAKDLNPAQYANVLAAIDKALKEAADDLT